MTLCCAGLLFSKGVREKGLRPLAAPAGGRVLHQRREPQLGASHTRSAAFSPSMPPRRSNRGSCWSSSLSSARRTHPAQTPQPGASGATGRSPAPGRRQWQGGAHRQPALPVAPIMQKPERPPIQQIWRKPTWRRAHKCTKRPVRPARRGARHEKAPPTEDNCGRGRRHQRPPMAPPVAVKLGGATGPRPIDAQVLTVKLHFINVTM